MRDGTGTVLCMVLGMAFAALMVQYAAWYVAGPIGGVLGALMGRSLYLVVDTMRNG